MVNRLAVKHVEIVAPFYTGIRFHLTQVSHVPHKGPDVGRPYYTMRFRTLSKRQIAGSLSCT